MPRPSRQSLEGIKPLFELVSGNMEVLATREKLEESTRLVLPVIPETFQISWPLLSARCGAEVWVKHENHTPIGCPY